MSRRKIHPDVEACVALCYPMEPTAKQALWEQLWQQHMEGEIRQTAHPEVAELLTFIGAGLAFAQRDVQGAHDCLAEFLSSPQASQIDYASHANLMGMQFRCLLFLNREAEALQIVSQLLNAPRPYDVHSNVITLCAHLGSYLWERQDDELASESVTYLLYDLLQRRQRKTFKTIPQQAAYGDLLALLIESSEAEERARQKRLAREEARK